jgi:hypothetical protein
MYLLLLCLLTAQETEKAVYMVDETVLQLPGSPTETTLREIYIKKGRVRVDFPGKQITFLYDLDLKRFIVVDTEHKTYYLNRPGHDKQIMRAPLAGITIINEASISPKKPVAIPTGVKRTISGEECQEYRLNLPENFGMSMSIWSTTSPHLDDTKNTITMWYAALGSVPPWDVKSVFTRLTNEVGGRPVQVETTIQQEGITITLTTTLKSIDREFEIPERFFEIPDNFEIVQNADDPNRPWRN